ncbi:mucin-like protein isoform X3 [Acropora muricata]
MSTSSEWTASISDSISEVSMTTSPSPSMTSLSQLCYSIFQTHSIQTNHSSLGLLLSTAISADMSTSSEWTASMSEVSMTTSPSPSMMSLSQLCLYLASRSSIWTSSLSHTTTSSSATSPTSSPSTSSSSTSSSTSTSTSTGVNPPTSSPSTSSSSTSSSTSTSTYTGVNSPTSSPSTSSSSTSPSTSTSTSTGVNLPTSSPSTSSSSTSSSTSTSTSTGVNPPTSSPSTSSTSTSSSASTSTSTGVNPPTSSPSTSSTSTSSSASTSTSTGVNPPTSSPSTSSSSTSSSTSTSTSTGVNPPTSSPSTSSSSTSSSTSTSTSTGVNPPTSSPSTSSSSTSSSTSTSTPTGVNPPTSSPSTSSSSTSPSTSTSTSTGVNPPTSSPSTSRTSTSSSTSTSTSTGVNPPTSSPSTSSSSTSSSTSTSTSTGVNPPTSSPSTSSSSTSSSTSTSTSTGVNPPTSSPSTSSSSTSSSTSTSTSTGVNPPTSSPSTSRTSTSSSTSTSTSTGVNPPTSSPSTSSSSTSSSTSTSTSTGVNPPTSSPSTSSSSTSSSTSTSTYTGVNPPTSSPSTSSSSTSSSTSTSTSTGVNPPTSSPSTSSTSTSLSSSTSTSTGVTPPTSSSATPPTSFSSTSSTSNTGDPSSTSILTSVPLLSAVPMHSVQPTSHSSPGPSLSTAIPGNFPPNFTDVPECVKVTLGQVFHLTVTAFDNDSAIIFSVLNLPIGANFSSSGNYLNFTWNVTSTERVQFTFVAQDEQGASTSSTPCIKMCGCQNGGQCVEPKVEDALNNASKFIYQGCNCTAGYTGRFCENDLNACELNGNPCFQGVSCTDHPAPANLSGFTCGPCPVGYNGDGIDCLDIDECASNMSCAQECNNTQGSFQCSCNSGFILNSDQRSCNTDPCYINPCLNNGTCHVDFSTSNYTFFCVCPIPKQYEGKDCGTPIPCFKDIMYPFGKEQGDHEITEHYVEGKTCPRVAIKDGLYFFDDQFYEIFICANGVLRFDRGFELRTPISNFIATRFQYEIPMLFPYWSVIERRKSFCFGEGECLFNHVNRSSVLYQMYTASSHTPSAANVLVNASEQVKEYQMKESGDFSRFVAKMVLVVTWLRLRPLEETPSEGITNTFQAVVITNGTYTFIKYHYPCGSLLWSAPEDLQGTSRYTYKEYPVAGFNAKLSDYDEVKSRGLKGTGTYEVKNLDMSNGNTDRKGEFFFRIEQRTGDDAKAKCNTWFEFQEKVLKDELLAVDRLITPCPCVFWQAWFDSRFSFEGWTDALRAFKSVTRRFSTGELLSASVHRRCNYDFRTGLAIRAEDSTLEVQYRRRPSNNLVEDSTARQLCLVESNSVDKFNRVRLPDNCGRYSLFPISRTLAFGDPHIKKLDGGNYTFNGIGEYTIVNADNGTFLLQARTQVAPGELSKATIFTAGVAKENGSATVEVKLKSGGGLQMYVNNSLYTDISTLTNVTRSIGENLRASKKSPNCVQVVFQSGTGVEFCEDKGLMSFVVSLSKDYFNKTKGLFGTYNKDPDDDFTLPNGTVLSPDITSRDIHFKFGLNWQITDQESLFTYGPGENVSTFANATFEPMFVEDIKWADNDTEAQAKKQCNSDVACLFDAASTNDVSIGVASREINIKVEKENKQLSNFPPNFTYVPECVNVTLGQVFHLTVTAFDNDSAIFFRVLNLPIGANFSSSGNHLNFTWNVTSTERVQFTFVAKDDQEASTSSTPCIKMCGCQNGGQCVEPKVGDALNNDSKFIYLGCNCAVGYTGRFCENDLNACELNGNPCFQGVSCTDHPAPANLSGFTCGQCPVGYNGDGINCLDIDECASNMSCVQECTNTPGSFQCSCRSGYTLNSDKRSCDDINECVPLGADCMHKCNNTIGNYTCSCNEFFKVDPSDTKNCRPEFNCSQDIGCNQVCYKSGRNGSETCDCYSGYKLASDTKTCADIDECSLPDVRCTQLCINTEGGFHCKCSAGFKLEADGFFCSDINECLDSSLFNCSDFQICENTDGNYVCKCQEGMHLINGSCKALKKGVTPPPPTLGTPKPASEQEKSNSVELRLVGMTLAQYNVTVDQKLKTTMAQQVNIFCETDRAGCGLKFVAKRRRRALNIFTADHVNLVPGFPIQENDGLRVAFYIRLPSVIARDGVIPVDALLQAVNRSKSELEAALGVKISEIKKGLEPTNTPTYPTSSASNATTVTSSTTSRGSVPSTGPTEIGEEANDDWKYIVVGVVVGAVIIFILGGVIYCVLKKKKERKVAISNENEGQGRGSPGSDVDVNRLERHEMAVYHGGAPHQPQV